MKTRSIQCKLNEQLGYSNSKLEILDEPSVPIPPPFINLKEDEREDEILTDQDNSEFTIKVPPHSVQQAKPPKQRNFMIHQRDPLANPRVPLISGRPFLWTARALIDVHGEEMILRDEDIIKRTCVFGIYVVGVWSLNLIKTKDLPPYHDNQSSGNPTLISKPETKSSSSSPTLISLEESESIWEEIKAYLVNDSFPLGNSNPSSLLPLLHNSLSGSTTSSSPCLYISETSNYFLEEFADELAHITFPPGNDDLPFDAESDLLELEYLLNHDPIKDMDSILEDSVDENSLDDNLDDTISEEFADELAPSESFPLGNDDMTLEDVIKEVKCLLTQSPLANYSLDNDLLIPSRDVHSDEQSLEYSSPPLYEIDKVFNPGILIHENLFEVTNFATPDKNVKKTINASLILEDFNPLLSLYELPFHKEVPGLGAVFSFSSENEEKVYNPGILTSKRVHTSLLPELSHRSTKAFKVTKILESPMEIFSCSYQEDIRSLDVPCLHFYPP
ncbi:hypothetical protein Tco_1468519 [Tanacetum coccineum]